MPGFQSTYRGGGGDLPAGYMGALTMPGRYLAAGIDKAGDSLASAVEKRQKDASEATTLRTALGKLYPDMKDDAATADLPTLRGMMQSKSIEQALQDREMQREQQRQQMDAASALERVLSQAGSLSPMEQAQQAFGEFIQNPMGSAGVGEAVAMQTAPAQSVPTAPTPERLLAALSRNPAAVNAPGNVMGSRILEQALQNVGGRSNELSFQEDPVSGMRFATYGNVLSPSGVNPTRAGEVVPLRGPNGEELGYAVRNKAGVQPLQTGAVTDKDKYAQYGKQLSVLLKAQAEMALLKDVSAAFQEPIDLLRSKMKALEAGPQAGSAEPSPDKAATGVVRYTWSGGKLVRDDSKANPGLIPAQ